MHATAAVGGLASLAETGRGQDVSCLTRPHQPLNDPARYAGSWMHWHVGQLDSATCCHGLGCILSGTSSIKLTKKMFWIIRAKQHTVRSDQYNNTAAVLQRAKQHIKLLHSRIITQQ
jgi:hypothetical protein